MVDLRTHLRRAIRRRWEKATADEKQKAASKASRGYWDKLGPDERSAEMKRRAEVRKKNQKRKRES